MATYQHDSTAILFPATTHLSSLVTIRAYEVVFTAIMVLTSIYTYRTRSPLYLGVYTAAAFFGGVVFEWVFDSKFFLRVSFDDRFVAFWTLQGVRHPLVMLPTWAGFFGGPMVFLLEHHELLLRSFGERGVYGFLALLGAVGTTAFETFCINVACIFRYHQRDEFLFYGMPYSNMLFVAAMVVMPYWSLRKAQILVKLLPRTAESKETQWVMAFSLGLSCVITAWVVAASANMIWYIWTEPWTETTRTF